jgi:hypothetical protein
LNLQAKMLAVLIGGMTKAKRDPAREERIEQEIIVDANSGEEQAMGWYYYLEDQRCFPFKAQGGQDHLAVTQRGDCGGDGTGSRG